jgi:hypothetical protein
LCAVKEEEDDMFTKKKNEPHNNGEKIDGVTRRKEISNVKDSEQEEDEPNIKYCTVSDNTPCKIKSKIA